MEAGECSKETDPGDTELGRSPAERDDSGNGATNAIENMPQDPSRPEMANEINMSSGETCDERKNMIRHSGSEGVAQESENLSILDDQPTSYRQTAVPTPSQKHTVRVSYYEDGSTKEGSMDEFITTLRASQLETLQCSLNASNERGRSPWDRQQRLEVIEAVSTCKSLKELWIASLVDVEEVEVLCDNLVSHPMLASLTLVEDSGTSGDGGDTRMEIVCNMLKNNRTIKEIGLRPRGPVTDIGVAAFQAMLSVNSTLETLDVDADSGITGSGVEVVLAPLTGHDGKPPLKSLKNLTLLNSEIGQREARAVAQMLRTNDSLTDLRFPDVQFSDPSDVCTILESLETNETLHKLDLSFCEAVRGDGVFAKMMDLRRVNLWLKDIELSGTPLERDGRAVQVKAQLEMNSRDYMAVVKGMPRAQPKFARVFLCGDGYSGKRLNQFLNKYLFSHTHEAH